jgi:hypothetical protein
LEVLSHDVIKKLLIIGGICVDGMTFGKMLTDHRAHFQRTRKNLPVEFATLWDWAEKHGIVQQAQ